MGKEYLELKKNNNVFQLSFIQKKYDAELFQNEHGKNESAILLSQFNKAIRIIIHPLTAPNFATRLSGRFFKKIDNIIQQEKIEAIHAEYASMAQYVKIKKKYSNIKFNVVMHDITVQQYERMKNSSQGLKKFFLSWSLSLIKRNEKKWLSMADNILVFSEKDKNIVNTVYKLENVYRINTAFSLEEKTNELKKYFRKDDIFFNVGFMGQMSRKENIEAAVRLIEIINMPELRKRNIRALIIGNNPPQELLNLRSDNVEVTGFIDDLDKYIIEECDLAVLPLSSGAGIKVKVLHFMALGIPVITSAVGAEGIDGEGKFIVLAESNSDFASAIQNYFEGNAAIDKSRMISYITDEFSWNVTREVFHELYEIN